jgi:hypothetical protein
MPNLFDEAIADAKALKEMAEANARNKIIESISPRIRQLIEQQMLAEQDDEVPADDEVPNLDLEALPDDMNSPVAAPAMGMASPAPGTPGAPDPDEEVTHTVTTKTASGTEVKINVRVDKHGEASASAESEEAPGDDVEVSLNKEGLEALADMVLGERKARVSYGTVRRQFESLKRVSQDLPISERSNFRAAYAILVKNTHDLQSQLLSNGGTPAVKQKFNTLVKEMKQMSTSARFRRLLEEMDRKPRLRREAKLVFEPTDLEGLDDEDFKEKLKGMSFGVEFAGEEEPGAAGAEEMPVDVSGTGAGASAPPAPAAGPAPVAEDDESFYEMMGDDDDDDSEDEGARYMDEDEDSDEEDDSENEGISFNVDESMLRRELRRIREAKGRSSKGKNAKGIKDPMPKAFGGGSVEGLPEELNHLSESDEAEAVASKALEVAKKATDAAKNERTARVEETRKNRELKNQLSESERANATIREQLEEVNLFNAKLLYVNKLMQNRDLTPRQQRAIVESLDAAKSVREAKLLFTSLTESLKSKSGTVNEGRILGSSSRSTRSGSASNLNESVEVDRWGILAGIKSGK